MKINEIEDIQTVSKTGFFKDLLTKFDKLNAHQIGKLQKFDIFEDDSDHSHYIALYDSHKRIYVGISALIIFNSKKHIFQESHLAVDPAYHGMNLGTQLYAWLIKNYNMTLIAGHEQSPGGRQTWEKLMKVPGIDVYGFNERNNKIFQLDHDDMDNDTDVYTRNIRDEINQLRSEFLALEKQLSLDKSNSKEIKHKMATIKKQSVQLRNAEYHNENYSTLIAMKAK